MWMNPMELWNSMGWAARLVFLFLATLSIYSLSVSFERWLRYREARKQSLAFTLAVSPLLKDGRLTDAIALAKKYPASHVAIVVSAGLYEFTMGAHGAGLPGHDVVEAVQRAMERAVVKTSEELKERLSGLATIATTAPFIGLFGTVVGIINAFRGMAVSGSGGLAAVSAGIAEALVTTALGLFVAIPAVWLYNYFVNKVDRFRVEMTNSGSELLEAFLKLRAARAA